MNNTKLKADVSEEEIRDGFFLAGQERESLEARLFQKPERLAVKIIPTWECNLRCKHCSVLHRLKKRDDFAISPDDVVRFMVSLKNHYNIKKYGLLFIGGECLLKTKECLLIADAVTAALGRENVSISLTTNLSLKLTQDSVRLLSLTNAFDVSLDGIEHQHNWQRKDADDNPVANPYKKTFFNIMRLVKLGLAEKIKVQAAVQDQVLNEEDKIKFFENLISVGVLLKNITYGGVHPTKKNPKLDDTYVNSLRSKTFWRVPCCDYRYMSHFSINPDGSFDDDYFQNVQRNIVRNISDFGKCYEISDLELSYREKIEKNMSVMNDRICLEKCPVLAYCWGRCHNNGYTLSNPSAHCDMKGLEEEVVKLHARDDK